ncbi:hypothetical protein CU097_005450 [Rhizopus azygosporus]|uniref:Uncharacterized protein n=1 Tax=Rhizopus azygosporus TaxID=86630 RepID=A0A367JHS6_RHIAZ|nr:hypothetical protein CU097_005450 [Rhizopus azygosporus]
MIEEMNSKNVTMKMYANGNAHMHEAGSQMKCLKRKRRKEDNEVEAEEASAGLLRGCLELD